jgi:hypothetical protein
MHSKIFSFSALLLTASLALPQYAEARGRPVECIFQWQENPKLNVKQGRVVIQKKVRQSLLTTLVEAGTVDAKVTTDQGGGCYITHPESKLFNRHYYSYYAGFRLDHSGRNPTCKDLKATVSCRDLLSE